jgi:hypothetical protein
MLESDGAVADTFKIENCHAESRITIHAEYSNSLQTGLVFCKRREAHLVLPNNIAFVYFALQ